MEAQHKSRKLDRSLYEAADKGSKQFIMRAVDEVWYKDLKHPLTFYNKVTAVQLMEHLQQNAGGLHETEAIDIQDAMKAAYAATDGIPDYINRMEALQAQSVTSELPITDQTMQAIANKSLIASGEYPRQVEMWNELDKPDRTWDAWKKTFRKAYLSKGRSDAIKNAEGEPFGGNATQQPSPPSNNNHNQQMTDSLEGALNNLAAAATSDRDTHEALVESIQTLTKSNATLSNTVDKQQKMITSLTIENNALKKQSASQSVNSQFMEMKGTGPKSKWVKGGYCWTHGYGVGPNHNSENCKAPDAGHKKEQPEPKPWAAAMPTKDGMNDGGDSENS